MADRERKYDTAEAILLGTASVALLATIAALGITFL
jgi:hypothetical protein